MVCPGLLRRVAAPRPRRSTAAFNGGTLLFRLDASTNLSSHGQFANNECTSLGEDDLHFLRIFVLCEGRIRDMESAMGVSYPTIKARMAQLKAALAPKPIVVPPVAHTPTQEKDAVDVLR